VASACVVRSDPATPRGCACDAMACLAVATTGAAHSRPAGAQAQHKMLRVPHPERQKLHACLAGVVWWSGGETNDPLH